MRRFQKLLPSILSIVGIVFVTACAWMSDPIATVTLSLDEGRAIASVGSLSFGGAASLTIAIRKLDGSPVAQKTFTNPAPRYELLAQLKPEEVYRAIAYFTDASNVVTHRDVRLFSPALQKGRLSLRLGHTLRIQLLTPMYDSPLINFSPIQFEFSGQEQQLDPGVKLSFVVPPAHQGTLTQVQYRYDGGPWQTVGVNQQPVISLLTLGLHVIEIRYRQESDGTWIIHKFNINKDT